MKVTFRGTPQLLRVGDIGESIVEADESLRQQITNRILSAVRNGDIPLRTKNGLKASPDGLEYVKSNARQTAKHKAEVRALTPSRLDLEMKILRMEKERYIESESHMQAIARGSKLAMYDAQILDLAHRQEYLIEVERERQRRDEKAELNKLYRNQFVQLFEVTDWLRKEQGFDVSIVQSNGEIAQKLARWFDSPLDDLPPKLREIAEAYIPNWHELSGADRRARADEADLQLQARLGARLEKGRMEQEQANATIPARFVRRQLQDGFNKVEREKKGERDFEAKRHVVKLSDERGIELAHSHELRIADWTELTGISIGHHESYIISDRQVVFRKWTDDDFSQMHGSEHVSMHRDNEIAALAFPCAPRMLVQYIDGLPPESHNFTVPAAFRQAVTAIKQGTDTAPQVPDEAQEQTAGTASPGTRREASRAKQAERTANRRTKVMALAQEGGEVQWARGERLISARSVATYVQTHLERDASTHGLRGAVGTSTIRQDLGASKWKFDPPKGGPSGQS